MNGWPPVRPSPCCRFAGDDLATHAGDEVTHVSALVDMTVELTVPPSTGQLESAKHPSCITMCRPRTRSIRRS